MDSRQKAINFIKRFAENHPQDFFRRLDDKEHGMGIIMHMLSESCGEVIAGDISGKLHMSTPRVAAALNTLESKGYVLRRPSERDRRKTVVEITPAGTELVKRNEAALIDHVEFILNEVGEQTMDTFLDILKKINKAHCKFFRKEEQCSDC